MPSEVSYLGEIVAICTTLSWSIGIFPFTEAARRMGPNAVNHIRLVFAVIFLSIICLLFLPISFTDLFTSPLPQHWIWFGASGIIGLALGDYFGFTSFVILGPRVGSIFTTLAPAAALISAFFLIGERINVIGIIGILITIAGVVWLSLNRGGKEPMKDHAIGNVGKGILFAILSAVCQGVGLVLANKGFETQINNTDLPFFQATWIRMIVAATVMYLITIVRGKFREMNQPILENRNNGLIFALGGTIFGPVMGVSLSMLAISLLHNKPSVAQTIFALVPVFVLPLSYLFYKEKITMQSVLAALIAIAGVMVLIWRDEILSFI
jgi:drug/metabolite transporter (DMT)-like permease